LLQVIPQYQDTLVEYAGSLLADQWVSLVDATLNGGQPCSLGAVAGATADNLHSGPIQGRGSPSAGVSCCSGSGKVLKVPQDTPATKLDSTKTFTVCFANAGSTTATWYDSGIKVRVSKIRYIEAYDVNHKTFGTIPNHKSLTMRYHGTVLNDRWISLVDQTLFGGNPCGLGTVAAGPKDNAHTGSRSATGNVFTVDTEALSATITFAVCYAESGGITTSTWRDTGIRLRRSMVTGVAYGVDTTRFGVGFSRTTYNPNTDDNRNYAVDVIPQIADVKLEYQGSLPNDKWISLVDDSLMNPGGGSVGNPCGYPNVAAAAPSTTHSGPAKASQLSGSSGGKIVNINQTSHLLDATKTFAVCYADGDGSTSDSTWADSYVRFKISKIETLGHHSALHTTTGMLANTGSTALQKLVVTYTGSLAAGAADGAIKITLVNETATWATHNLITTSRPCSNPAVAGKAADATGLYSGPLNAENGQKKVKIDTTSMHTGSITGGVTLVPTVFALCYSENGAAATPTYVDSGIRLTVGKMQQILHGTPTDLPYEPRPMRPVLSTMLTSGLASAQNVIPQAANQVLTYVSPNTIKGDPLPDAKYVSLIEATLNANKPCSQPTIAGATADSFHSGTTLAGAGTKTLTIAQSTLLDATKTFAICYAITSGTIADVTWADSYIRVTISKIQQISSLDVTHKVSNYVGHIASRAGSESHPTGRAGAFATQPNLLDITYYGTLPTHMYISLIDHDLGSTPKFPCLTSGVAAAAADSQHSGSVRAGTLDRVALVKTETLQTTSTFAVCYSEDATAWFDSGIRVKRTEIKTLLTDSTHTKPGNRIQSSVFHSTNRLPQAASQKLTYTGELPNDKWLSLVDNSLNNKNPCVKGAIAAAAADSLHSGVMIGRTNLGNVGGKVVTVLQNAANKLLDASKVYTVCYSSVGPGSGVAWQDSYIRFKMTKLAYIEHTTGKWTGYTGQTIRHVTLGQLPNQYSGARGLGITYAGSLATNKFFSFVDSELSPTVTHGIRYNRPCDDGNVAAAGKDSTHSGVLTASGQEISTLDSTVLSTSKTYALCYAETNGTAADTTWADSGIRITFSRVINVQFESGHATHPRDMTSVFYMTNVLPQSANMQLTYIGDVGVNKSISLVSADLPNARPNPCVDGSIAAATADVYHSGVMTAAGKKITVPQSTTAKQLEKSKIFAICYSEASSSATASDAWYDSYIRLRISLVKEITMGGITLRTTGQIPNVNTNDQYAFTYAGSLGVNKYLSFIDERENANNPCIKTIAATTTTTSARSGAKQASGRVIKSFDTASLNTSLTFALCYSEADGSTADSTWTDSGIRVTTPKVWNLLYDSGVVGPTCTLPSNGPVNTNCKLDTKPRDMTSYPLATNKIPQVADIQLTYVGSLPQKQYISLVDVSLDAGKNPCANGQIAGASASSTSSGPLLANPGTKTVKIPQNILLNATKVFAICYDDGAALPPAITSTRLFGSFSAVPVTPSLQGTAGGSTSRTWRDTFVRVRISKIRSLKVSTSNMPSANTHSYTSILTHGQIPVQQALKQVHYEYTGSLGTGKHISLVDASLDTVPADPDTTIARPNPCNVLSTAKANADAIHTGALQAASGTRIIKTLNTETTGGANVPLDSTKTFALCYAEALSAFFDSGIRVTVSKVTAVKYLDMAFNNPSVLPAYTRTMTSVVQATNKIPQAPNQKLVYAGTSAGIGLAAGKYLSLIDTTKNQNHPCLNPTVAAASSDSTHSGSEQAATVGSAEYEQKTVTIKQTTLLNETKVYAVCYAEGDGSTNDKSWRDSYIRLTLSKIEYLKSYKVVHRVSGQIPNHGQLKIDYFGSLTSNKNLAFFDETLVPTTVLSGSGQTYAFPCFNPPTSATQSLQVAGQAGLTNKSVTIDSTALHSEKVFAVCYTETPLDMSSYVDTGIRITVPAIYNMQADSGYSGVTSTGVAGVPVRDMKSWDQTDGSTIIDRPTNRFPRERLQKLIYVPHSTVSSPEGLFISMVDAGLNNDDPCVIGSIAAAGRLSSTTQHSNVAVGKTKADAPAGRIVTINQDNTPTNAGDPNTALLDATKTFAVCYTLTGGLSTSTWKDTYVRLKLTKVTSLVTVGVTHRTFGQVPNTPTADAMLFEYQGDLANTRFISFVDETVNPTANNVGNPCTGTYATAAASAQSSGVQRAQTLKRVTTMNTQIMSTTAVFAVCYAEVTGASSDSSWADSGIRITVPRVWNVLYSSGHTGPACPVSSVLNTNCKLDTKARDTTSRPYATNRFPQEANQQLTYVGDMLANKYISLVDASLNNNNPCVSGAIGGGTPGAVGGGGSTNARRASGPVAPGSADSKLVTIPQGTNNLLDASKEFAVCYDDGLEISSTSTQYPAAANTGTATSPTWRDSYIRFQITKITSLDLSVSNMPYFNNFTTIPIRTHGQLPNQASYKQMSVTYTGSLPVGKYISLVDSTEGSEQHTLTLITRNNPCEDATIAKAEGASDAAHTGAKQAVTGTKTVRSLDTKNVGGRGLYEDRLYALCYSETNGAGAGSWFDSGIRITVPKIHTLHYVGAPATITARTRAMTSETEATHKLPQFPGQQLKYLGSLAAGKWVSIVDSSLNSNNPCVNPQIAAAAASSTSSGSILASSKTVTVPQLNLLHADKIFAVCYSESTGTGSDLTWRDSYIRLSMTKVETVSSIGVTHRTTGQIGDHAALELLYVGSLANNKYLALVESARNEQTIGWGGPSPPTAKYPFPCIEAQAENGADALHSAVVQAGTNDKTVRINTQGLQRSSSNQNSDIKEYAICYTDGIPNATSTAWADTGIRVTITEVYEVLLASGHTGPNNKPDTMPRHMSSIFGATNRFPQAAGHTLTYVTHSTSTMSVWAAPPSPPQEFGYNKWISLVDASLQGGDPCVIGTVAAASLDDAHSGAQRAGVSDKAVTIPQGTLLKDVDNGVEKVYAVCYAKLNGGTTDSSWRDSYIRLRMSKIESLHALGVVHKTVGQIPNTPANLQMEFTYSGSLAGSQYVSLVRSTLNSNFPCNSNTEAAAAAECPSSGTCTTGAHSGVHQGTSGKVVKTFDTTGLSTTYLFALCYAQAPLASATWTDSGIRLTVPKVHSVKYSDGYSGTIDRVMTSYPAATNRLPRVPNIKWTYAGDLPSGKHMSVVSAALNSGNPCVHPQFAAAPVTTGGFGNDMKRYSGKMTATGREVTILQATNNLLFSGIASTAESYAICYSEGDGSNTDVYWRDSYIRVKTSELYSFISKEVTHKTFGQLPSHPSGLEYIYGGSLVATGWVSLVDATLGTLANTGFATAIYNPCECAGANCANLATGSADESHSGKAKATISKVTAIPTTQLWTNKTYALCYSKDSSTITQHSGNFFDSGIRLTVPKVTGIQYSGYSQPVAAAKNKATRLMNSVLAPLQASNSIVANVLPQMTKMPLVYVGDLGVSKYISLVAITATINNKNPCVDSDEAAHSMDSTHSGPVRSCLSYEGLCTPIGVDGTTAGNKEVVIPQGTYLNDAHQYTICYAENDGTTSDPTWRDSYIRVSISKIQSIVATGVTHSDHGLIADHTSAVPLQIEYVGTLAQGMHVSLVDETENNQNPCVPPNGGAPGAIAGAAADATHSGPITATTSTRRLPTTTSGLSTSTQFAVCYTTKDQSSFTASTWKDSGVRIKKSKLKTIRYNNGQTPAGQFLRDHFTALVVVGGTGYAATYQHTFIHKIPQIATSNLQLSYIGDLPASKYISLVSISQNNGDPCAVAAVAGGNANDTKTGVSTADGNKLFTFSSASLHALNAAQAFTICYADTAGAPGVVNPAYSGVGHMPSGWRDSYIRFTISKIDYVTSHQAQHRTQGHIANLPAYGLTYAGTLGNGKYLSLVDETLASSNPCGTSSIAAKASATDSSGPKQATSGSKQVVFDTSGLDTGKNFAICYSESGTIASPWFDSGIRVTISALTTITYNNDQPATQAKGEYKRIMTSSNLAPASDLIPMATNRIPQVTNTKLIYAGNTVANPAAIGASMPTNKFLSFIAASLNNNNPCADKAVAGKAPPDSTHSGALGDSGGIREVTIAQVLSDAEVMAVCYTVDNGGAADTGWRDSYIRVKVSKVASITSYGIVHTTDGMVASKPALRVKTLGTFANDKMLSLVDASLNAYQPCMPTLASTTPTNANQDSYSGLSTSNTGNKHTLKTDKLSSAKTFALCYAEGNGTSADLTWADSGLRLNTPKLTSIKYMHPVRELTASSCFGAIDLWGRADCRLGAVGTAQGDAVTFTTTAARNSQLPQATNVTVSYHGPSIGHALANNKFISLVEHSRGAQTNNPCRDANQAAAAATSGTSNARLHSGVVRAGAADSIVTIPQLTGTTTPCTGTCNLLDYDKTFALCYAEGDGSTTDTTWRDSYVRITLTKIATLTASDMVIHTTGMYANVPSLRITHTGSLGPNKWLTIVDASSVAFPSSPCDKSNAGAASYRRPYASPQDSTTDTKLRSPALQAGVSSKMMDFNTTMLNGNNNLYIVCYAFGDGSHTDQSWMDSGIRLRFVKWTNSRKTRFVSGAASQLTFQINEGNFSTTSDKVVLLKGKTDCSEAPTATLLSNGDKFMRFMGSGNKITLPSGTGVTDTTADGWYMCNGQGAPITENGCTATNSTTTPGAAIEPSCSSLRASVRCCSLDGTTCESKIGGSCMANASYTDAAAFCTSNGMRLCSQTELLRGTCCDDAELGCGFDNHRVWSSTPCPSGTGACESTGAYTDYNLNEGAYIMCFCDSDNGNGACDSGNEFVKVASPFTGDSIKVISAPRLGRIIGLSHVGNIRGLAGKSHTYNIKGSTEDGYEVQDGDRIFFQAGDCATVPGAASASETKPIPLTGFDDLSNSSTYQAARVITPVNLTTLNGKTRSLVACFATKESLEHEASARNYVRLVDGLEIIPYPRLGPLTAPGNIRSVSSSQPTFHVDNLKHGDQMYFKMQAIQGGGSDDDCLLGATQVTGDITSVIPSTSSTSETARLTGHAFTSEGGGKVTIPALTQRSIGGMPAPLYLSTCFIPAGSMDTLQAGTNCPLDSPNTISNSNGGTCTAKLANAVKLQDDLQIFPEPTDALVTSWFRSHVYELKFTQPQWGVYGTKTFAAGQEGDIVVLQKEDCNNVHSIHPSTYSLAGSHSAKFTLEEYGNETQGDEKGGVAQVIGLATGKVNELPIGMYKICYATKNSEGDDAGDFKMLGSEIEILPETATTPHVDIPQSILLGQDLTVEWSSTINLQTRLQTQNSWIGLYRNGTCMPKQDGHVETDVHECFVAYQFIQSGVESGSVRFSQADYQIGGTYDVRFFQGDTRNVQGRVCRGLSDAPLETYVQCVLEAALISGPIEIVADRSKMANLDSVPGMEVLFTGNRGRYADGGNPVS
jgi:hypothetical protein